MLKKNTTLLEEAKRSQIVGSKYKKVFPENNRDHQSSKKTKDKQPARYYRDIKVKIGSTNLCEKCMHAGQDCFVYHSR